MAFHLSILTLLAIKTVVVYGQNVTINTKLGSVIGLKTLVLNNYVYIFRKIPYAKASIGNLRFVKPEPYGPWDNTLDGRASAPSCFQILDPLLQDVYFLIFMFHLMFLQIIRNLL